MDPRDPSHDAVENPWTISARMFRELVNYFVNDTGSEGAKLVTAKLVERDAFKRARTVVSGVRYTRTWNERISCRHTRHSLNGTLRYEHATRLCVFRPAIETECRAAAVGYPSIQKRLWWEAE